MGKYKLIFVIKWSTNKWLPKVDNFIRNYNKETDKYYSIGYSNNFKEGAYRIHLEFVNKDKLTN